MALLDFLKGLKAQSPSSSSTNTNGLFGFFSPSSMPRMTEKEELKSFIGWVYACTDAIAERLADIDLFLEYNKNGQWTRVEKHPAMDLLHAVNPFTTFNDLFYATEAFQQLNGNTFWKIVYNKGGQPCELWVLDPTRINSIKDKDKFISGYEYAPEGASKMIFRPQEIIHFKRFNPTDMWRGLGTVSAAALAIDTDKYSIEWQRNFFGNAAMPSGILSTDQVMQQDQYDRVKFNWDTKFKGVPNAHKLAILEGGLKWTNVTPASREMQFTESRKNLRDEILGYFGVPKPVLGILEDVNLASADAADTLFNKFKVRPRMRFHVGVLNESYLPLFNLSQNEWRFNFTDPVPENIDQKLEIIENGRQNAWMTKNEARAMFNLEPKEGGDVFDEPTLMVPQPGTDKPDNPQNEEDLDQEEEEATEDEKNLKVKKKASKKTAKKEISQEELDYKAEQIDQLHKTYLSINEKLRKQLLKKLKTRKSLKLSLINRLTHTKDATNEVVNFLIDDQEYGGWAAVVYNATQEGLQRIFEKSGQTTLANLQLQTDFSMSNDRAINWLKDHALEDSDSYSGTMKDGIISAVQQGVEQGGTNENIADSINQYFDDTSDYSAMRIARTETINAYGAGTLEGYKQSGVVSGKYWIADANACPICEGNVDDGVIGLDEDFSSGDDAPAAHPNCECSLGGETDENA